MNSGSRNVRYQSSIPVAVGIVGVPPRLPSRRRAPEAVRGWHRPVSVGGVFGTIGSEDGPHASLATASMAPTKQSRDWVLISHIVGHAVSPEKAAVLYEDDEFWAEIETRVASSDED